MLKTYLKVLFVELSVEVIIELLRLCVALVESVI